MHGYCKYCGSLHGSERTYHANTCRYFKMEESVTQKFEVGDVVNVRGTVSQVWNHGKIKMADVYFGGSNGGWAVPTDILTFVERPDKFKVGTLYHRTDRTDAGPKYMYLGDGKFYCYSSEEVLTKDTFSSWLHLMVPVS